jgi:hypothetical protein
LINDPNANHVAVQSCGTGANTAWHNENCVGGTVVEGYGTANLGLQANLGTITMADGNYHTVTIQYNASLGQLTKPCAPTVSLLNNLCIYIDQTAAPVLTVSTDLSSIGLTNGTAYVGLTGATGAAYETHDVLNWSFTIPTQTQTQPVTPGTTNTITFNNTAGSVITHTVSFPTGSTGGVTSPVLQSQNFPVSNSTGFPPYVVGTPFATAQLFLKKGDNPTNSTDYGSIFKDACSDASNAATPASDANCPVAATGTYIGITDQSDLVSEPAIAPGTTVGLIEYVPNLITTQTDWNPAPAGMTPNSACTNVVTSTFKCDLTNILWDFHGDCCTTSSGGTPKKGTFATVYNVPMLTSAPKINAISVNTAAPIYVRSPLTFDFVVTPAQLPANTTNANGFTAAPVSNLFYAFNSTAIALPKPIVPNCPITGSCNVTGGTPGSSSTLPVEFTSSAPATYADGAYVLQWSAGDTVGTRELNVLLTPTTGNCPDGSPATLGACYSTNLFSAPVVVDNTAPALNLTFSPSLSGPGFLLNQSVTATVSCTDPGNPGTFSGVKTCQSSIPKAPSGTLGCSNPAPGTASCSSSGAFPTATPGSTTITFTGGDFAGNALNAASQTYKVLYQPQGTLCLTDAGHQVLPPFDQTTFFLPIKRGRSIPVKFRVCDANGKSIGPTPVIKSVNVVMLNDGSGDTVEDTLDAIEDTDFHWDATNQQWIYNLRTRDKERLVKYTYTVTLNDGSSIVFSFTPK